MDPSSARALIKAGVRAFLVNDLAESKAHGQAPIEKALLGPHQGPKRAKSGRFCPPGPASPPLGGARPAQAVKGLAQRRLARMPASLGHALRGGHGNEPGNPCLALWCYTWLLHLR